jgi:excisionase family DNA binding protein
LLKIDDAAPIAGLTAWRLRTLVSRGELPVVRVGRRLYVRAETLNKWAKHAEAPHETLVYRRAERAR